MKLSPLEIRKQEFNRNMRGYDVDEVRAFLSSIAGQMDELIEEQEKAAAELEQHKSKMGHLEDVQEALQATLNMARKNAEETREAALSKAEMIIHEAHLKGEEVLKKAERELDKLRTDISNLEVKRDQMLAKLKSVLTAEMEMLESIKPERADKQEDSGIEVAQLSFIDPEARAHREKMLAKARAAAVAQRDNGRTETEEEEAQSQVADDDSEIPDSPISTIPDEEESDEDVIEFQDAGDEKPDIAEVVASLKASVEDDESVEEVGDGADGELEEMRKIRRILDDLE